MGVVSYLPCSCGGGALNDGSQCTAFPCDREEAYLRVGGGGMGAASHRLQELSSAAFAQWRHHRYAVRAWDVG